MLIIYALAILISLIFYKFFALMAGFLYSVKISMLVDKIQCKDDLIFLRVKDYENVIAEIFRRKGFKVCLSDHFGEGGTGIILNDLYYVLARKERYPVEIEFAKKLCRHMRNNSIYKGIIVTLGDFKANTRNYCHTNVITCIGGNQLLQMCKNVQGAAIDTIFENLRG